jgi:hypothetical protein
MIKTMKKAEVKVYLLLSFSKRFLIFLDWQKFCSKYLDCILPYRCF